LHRLILAALVIFSFSTPAMAAITPDDPACVGKQRGQICKLMDGAGGFCAPARCGKEERPCLRCAPARAETGGIDSALWIPMLAFGVLVMLVGSVFWFRIKRNWDKPAEARKEGR
jgi:hypothetical protein